MTYKWSDSLESLIKGTFATLIKLMVTTKRNKELSLQLTIPIQHNTRRQFVQQSNPLKPQPCMSIHVFCTGGPPTQIPCEKALNISSHTWLPTITTQCHFIMLLYNWHSTLQGIPWGWSGPWWCRWSTDGSVPVSNPLNKSAKWDGVAQGLPVRSCSVTDQREISPTRAINQMWGRFPSNWNCTDVAKKCC